MPKPKPRPPKNDTVIFKTSLYKGSFLDARYIVSQTKRAMHPDTSKRLRI